MSRQKITVGLSVHRPEMIPFIADLMQKHEAVFLEEPPDTGFEAMLSGSLSADDYVRQLDAEYPVFTREMCDLLRALNGKGRNIFQVEPYLEALIKVHEFFADGHCPEDLDKASLQYPVYLAERNATGALLTFYQTAVTGSFAKTLRAVKRFARLDAARFRLRDLLRAQALEPMLNQYPSVFIEAGVIHYPLWLQLHRQISTKTRLELVFLTDTALQTVGKRGRLYGPGDLLTLLYVFHPNLRQPRRESLLAARSLIYSKLIVKEELVGDRGDLPHLRDEISCIQMVRRLSLKDCRRLFPKVRHAGLTQAHQIVADHLAVSTPHRSGKQ